MTFVGGDRFRYRSVADRYHYRPAYDARVITLLLEELDSTSRVLDLGCGPGKLSYELAPHVARVDAIDMSDAMLQVARQDPRSDANISWFLGNVGEFASRERYDLIVAGTSVHWFDHDTLFPMLAGLQTVRGRVALLAGDEARGQAWEHEEVEAMKRAQIAANDERPAWVDVVQAPRPVPHGVVDHPNFDVQSRQTIGPTRVRQVVSDYIECFFSRQSFAEETMPSAVAADFRAEMADILAPWADGGFVEFDVYTAVDVGRFTDQ